MSETPGLRILAKGKRHVYVNERDGTCQIAEGFWLPGIYADEQTAWAAFDYDDAILQAVQDRDRGIGADYRPITLDELRKAAS